MIEIIGATVISLAILVATLWILYWGFQFISAMHMVMGEAFWGLMIGVLVVLGLWWLIFQWIVTL